MADNMFLFKKVISPLFYPLTLCIILMICGLFLLWFSKCQRSGKLLVSMSVIFLTMFSYGAISDSLLAPLERTYPPLLTDQTSEPLPIDQRIKWIVVLGGSHISDPLVPVASQLSFASLARLTEAVRIYRRMPRAKLILSGGTFAEPISEAEIYFKTARIMDVPSQDLVMSGPDRDTEEEARTVQKTVGRAPFILVTSALHMPRAIALFKKRGMNPVPAPAAHLVRQRSGTIPEDFYPSARELWKAQMAVHEYLGILWYKLKESI